jgi:hypothetical protein
MRVRRARQRKDFLVEPLFPPPDFEFQKTLSRCLLRPLTPAAERWLDRRFARTGDVEWFAGALVVASSLLPRIVDDIRRDALGVRS